MEELCCKTRLWQTTFKRHQHQQPVLCYTVHFTWIKQESKCYYMVHFIEVGIKSTQKASSCFDVDLAECCICSDVCIVQTYIQPSCMAKLFSHFYLKIKARCCSCWESNGCHREQAEMDHMCTQREIDERQLINICHSHQWMSSFFSWCQSKRQIFASMFSRLIGASIWNINVAAVAPKHNVLFVSLFTHFFLFFNNTSCCKSLNLYH